MMAPRFSMSGSDDLEAAVGRSRVGGSCRQARGVFVAHGVESAEVVLGAVRLNFQVVGDGVASFAVAEDHFVFGVFELEALQHVLWSRGSSGAGSSSFGPRGIA